MELKELLEIIYGVIGSTVIPAFTVFLGYQINKFIQSKVSVDEQIKIDEIVKATILWVEQVYGDKFFGEEKLQLAKLRILELLKGMKIDISEEYLETLIEAFVNEINWSKKDLVDKEGK